MGQECRQGNMALEMLFLALTQFLFGMYISVHRLHRNEATISFHYLFERSVHVELSEDFKKPSQSDFVARQTIKASWLQTSTAM